MLQVKQRSRLALLCLALLCSALVGRSQPINQHTHKLTYQDTNHQPADQPTHTHPTQVSKVLQGDPDKVLDPYIKGKGNARALSDKALEASGGQQERGCLDIIILLDTYIYKHNTPSPPPPFQQPHTNRQTNNTPCPPPHLQQPQTNNQTNTYTKQQPPSPQPPPIHPRAPRAVQAARGLRLHPALHRQGRPRQRAAPLHLRQLKVCATHNAKPCLLG